jgi:hypothetical protein
VRAVELVKRERQLRAAAEDRATKAEVQRPVAGGSTLPACRTRSRTPARR